MSQRPTALTTRQHLNWNFPFWGDKEHENKTSRTCEADLQRTTDGWKQFIRKIIVVAAKISTMIVLTVTAIDITILAVFLMLLEVQKL